MNPLSGRVAIVTGSAANIGRAIALALARDGAIMLVHAKSNAEGVGATATAIAAAGGRAVSHLADLTREAGAESLVRTALESFGGLDILVNNAALRRNAPFVKLSLGEWHEVLLTNLDAALLACRAAVPHIIAGAWGRIVNIGGLSAHRGVSERAHVATAKAGLVGFTKSLATKLAEHGITANFVVPGRIDTVRGAAAGRRPADQRSLGNLAGRDGTPDEIAHAVATLCHPLAGYTTGQTIHVSGGAYLP